MKYGHMVLAAALTISAAVSAAQNQHKNQERGFNANKTDFYNARRVVNGMVPAQARDVQRYAKVYLRALTASGWK